MRTIKKKQILFRGTHDLKLPVLQDGGGTFAETRAYFKKGKNNLYIQMSEYLHNGSPESGGSASTPTATRGTICLGGDSRCVVVVYL